MKIYSGGMRACALGLFVMLARCGDEEPDFVVERASCRDGSFCTQWLVYPQSELAQPQQNCARGGARWSSDPCPSEQAIGRCIFIDSPSSLAPGRFRQRVEVTYMPEAGLLLVVQAECGRRGGQWATR